MFRRADELERYFNETGLDIFKDFDEAWMRFKMAESWKKREGCCLRQVGEIWPMTVPKFEKVVDEFCRFQELINLLTVVCIDVKGSGCESFEGGRESMKNFIVYIKHCYGILPVSVPHC